jgi:hypothetical protein
MDKATRLASVHGSDWSVIALVDAALRRLGGDAVKKGVRRGRPAEGLAGERSSPPAAIWRSPGFGLLRLAESVPTRSPDRLIGPGRVGSGSWASRKTSGILTPEQGFKGMPAACRRAKLTDH